MKNAKILVIEDKNSATISIKSKLEDLGYTVLAIEPHHIKTVKSSGELKPDLILMEVNKGSCTESVAEIKNCFDCPKIYITDYPEDNALDKIKIGLFYIIEKPVNDDKLKNAVENALYNYLKLKLNDINKNLNAFLNAINEPAFLIDLNGNILFTTDYTEKILGEVVGSNIYEILPLHIAQYRKKYVDDAIKTKKIISFEDNSRRMCYEYRIYPILDKKNEVSKLAIIGLNIAARKAAANERQLTVDFLRLVNESKGTKELVHKAVSFLKQRSGCDAVGIRIRKGNEYPYFESEGFSDEFILTENRICAYDHGDNVILDHENNPVLECMCGNVICGRFDDSKPFTAHGSFWTSSTTELLSSAAEADGNVRICNRCNEEGYESAALIPLHVNKQKLGILQLNSRQKETFTPNTIDLWERIADQLAIALAKFRAEDALLESEEKYRSIFQNSTDAIFLTLPDGSILDANPAAEEMYEYTKEEMRKLGRSGILDTNDPRLHLSINERSVTGKFKSEFSSIKKDGTKFLTDVRGKLFTDPNGAEKGIIIARDITEHKKIENELKENQRTFETLISNLPGVVYRCRYDPDWTMEFVSDGCLELTGYQPEDLIMNKNVSYGNLIHYEDRQIVRDVIQGALKVSKPFKITYRIITADLKEKYVWEQGSGIFSSEGDLIALEGFITDITKRKKAEKELQKSELYYRTIFENTGTATLIAGEDTVISLANTECEKLSGYSKEEIEGKKSWMDFAVEEDMEQLLSYHNMRKQNKSPKNYEIRLQDKQGNIKDVYVTIELIPYTGNRVISLLDITDKKRSRKALKENERKYRQLVENAHEGIWSVDNDGNTTFVNPRMANMLGYTSDEMKNMHLLSFMDEKKAKIVKTHMKEYKDIEEGKYEFEFVKKDGKQIYVSIDLTQIYDDHGNYIESLALISDITERRKAEEKLKLASKYNRSLIEASLDPLVTIGSDGKITDVNKSTEIITGYSRKQLIGTDFSDYFTQPEKARNGYQQVFKEGLVRDYPLEIKNKDGCITPVLYNASVYKDDFGNVIGVFAAARDITQLKKAEENIKSSLEEKEILLREIHHRVKNNLQIISSLLSLQTSYIKDDETLGVLEESQNRVKSMAMVHEKLYNSENLVKIDFKDYIKDLTDSLFLTYKIYQNGVKLNKKIDNTFFNINTAIPCGLIINELVTNSLKHAFPTVDPATTNAAAASKEIQINLHQSKGNFVLMVSDTGVGLPESVDFRNTESLGLRLVTNLVKQLEGTIELDRSGGTKFKITFKELIYKNRI